MRISKIIFFIIVSTVSIIDAAPHKRNLAIEIDLKSHYNDRVYSFPISFGDQSFTVIFDTGASELWVAEKRCTTCGDKQKFDPENQGCHFIKQEDQPFHRVYGTGRVDGYMGTADLTFGGTMVRAQTFGLATMLSPNYLQPPLDEIDGTIGFGLGDETPFQQLVEEDILKFSVFGLFLGNGRGQLLLGDLDESFGKINSYHDLVNEDLTRWYISLDGVTVNNKGFNFQSKNALIDSAASAIFIPLEDARAIGNLIPEVKVSPTPIPIDRGSIYRMVIPCSFSLKFILGFDETFYRLDPATIIGDPVRGQPQWCNLRIFGSELNLGNIWILGIPFLKNVYTAFNLGDSTVGFAQI